MKDPVTPLTAVAIALAIAAFSAATRAGEPAPVVVELFTSQGCNSCPPADAVLGDLARHDDVLALSFHVTYWDRLGWPDTFGLEASTRRQERYADWLDLDALYTPQMVVGGRLDLVGSRKARVLEAIELLRAHAAPGLEIAVTDDTLTLGSGAFERAIVWLAAFDDAHDVRIERGENAGRTLRYHHVVREIVPLGEWRGRSARFELPLARLVADGRDGAAILVQRARDGAMLGALEVDLPAG